MSGNNKNFDDQNGKSFPIFDHDTNIPYANRSIRMIVWVVITILLVGGFVGWFFYGSSSEYAERTNSQKTQMADSSFEQDSAHNPIYDFFYKMFSGVEDGLEDNPHSLDNIEDTDNLNLDTGDAYERAASAKLAIEEYEEYVEGQSQKGVASGEDDEYRHSIVDVVGSEIYGRKGQKTGDIFDVLVHKDTGKAKAVVLNEDESRSVRDLASLGFKKVLKQQVDGDILLTVAEERVEDTSEFRYADMDAQDYVSLRHLRDGQLIDFEGEVAGQIEAVIYENAEAQTLYFTLRPALAQQGAREFQIPFEEAEIVENRGGYDIQLTKAQTAALAKFLFEQEGQQQ